MIRGTTPTHQFTLSVDTKLLRKVKIVYAQDDEVIVEKDTDDCVLDGNTVKVKLTQEDTFKFDHKKLVQIQVRAVTNDNDAVATTVMCTSVEKCLDDEVME